MSQPSVQPLAATNDFVVKFANVNGSGSASANELFARSILRMGVPVCSRNIFPSNIQGLPTWYEVRVSGEGWLGRRGDTVDMMVAMNPQTWNKDVDSIEPGGYLFYDSTKPLTTQKLRSDVTLLGVPLMQLSNTLEGTIPRERQLLKNVIYLGAVAQLLSMPLEVVESLIADQFAGKDKLIKLNYKAMRLGAEYAAANLAGKCKLKVEKADKVGDRIFIQGNDAAGLGAVFGGATVCAWYPITPSTSLAEAFTAHCKKFRVDPVTKKNNFAIVQAEDEIAAIGMVIGAGWNGARSFTATSGPGISLMQEFFGLAYFAEVPAVVFDIQRGGPSTGMPTRTQQSDILLAAYASHGDTKHVLLFPEDPREAFEFAAQAFDLAERLQTPVFVMLDLDIGMNDWLCKPLAWDDSRKYDRGKIMTAEMLDAGTLFGRYLDVDGDAIPYRTLPATHPSKGSYFTRGSSRNTMAKYSEEGADYVYNMQRLLRKMETAKTIVPAPVRSDAKEKTKVGAIYYGSTSPAMDEALDRLEKQGIHLNTLRIRAFPFAEEVVDFINAHDQVFVVEQNRDAQLQKLIVNECAIDPARFISILHYDGTPITARFITSAIADRMKVTHKEAAE
ncbi:MAG: 2-oxoacid:acceptor oxidoreductase subunit alpha [Alphaproteobacteria bacterium]|nr:2-oxoacid:acceptor oxidoreductase subunit alpha [Alphaproteobacteria bacterium]